MRFRGGEVSTGTTGNFMPELTRISDPQSHALWGVAQGSSSITDWLKAILPIGSLQLDWRGTFQSVVAVYYAIDPAESGPLLTVDLECATTDSAVGLSGVLEGLSAIARFAQRSANSTPSWNPFDDIHIDVEDKYVSVKMQLPGQVPTGGGSSS